MASINLTSQLATHAQQQSPFFNKLPVELRNRIYKMAFEDHFNAVKLVCIWRGQHAYIRDIVLCPGPGAPAPPSSAFVRSCQRIHNEAVAIFTAAAEAYWDSEKEFIVAPGTWWKREPEGLHIPLKRIRNFTFLLRPVGFVSEFP